MKFASLSALACASFVLSLSGAAAAQEGGFALNQLQPSPAGDTFIGLPSPYAAGHLAPSAYLMFDYAHRPIRLSGATSTDLVAAQGFMRLDGSLALWDRLLVNVDVPMAVIQSGDDPNLPGTTHTELDAPLMGDTRVGLRGRLLGDNAGPFQLGLGGYLFVPTGEQEQYVGEGAVRGSFHAAAGGRVGGSIGFAYGGSFGAELRGSDSPQALTYGAGAAFLLLGGSFQLQAELVGVTALGGDVYLSSTPVRAAGAGTNAEVLFGAKAVFFDGIMVGAAGGPGVGSAVGTPKFRVLAMLGWAPLPGPSPQDGGEQLAVLHDSDDDGIPDKTDACPNEAGDPSTDEKLDGCPPADRDKDGVLDVDDACPSTAGLRSGDATDNGCPADSDGDGQHDGIDACRATVGVASEDPMKNGCPSDQDGDAIADGEDACPLQAGPAHEHKAFSGCPPDPDGDGVLYSDDACPQDKGVPNEKDPTKNGCPRFVRITKGEIVITERIEFETYGDSLGLLLQPKTRQVLKAVARALQDHPEITKLEVQGHTDDSGDHDFNVGLSQRRAESVRKWLIDKGGVAGERLTAKGYGPDKPIADNRLREGREKNRRVQFVIQKTDKSNKK